MWIARVESTALHPQPQAPDVFLRSIRAGCYNATAYCSSFLEVDLTKFIIEGGHPVSGTITPKGNKNAALPAIAATLLTDEKVILRNVPRIGDVLTMLQILKELGSDVKWIGEETLEIDNSGIESTDLDPELCYKIRASLLFAGPMLARFGEVNMPPPGGDVIGRRRVDTHLLAFRKLGAEISLDKFIHLKAKKLEGTTILLDEASVTGTENAVMAASLAKGKTTIFNAASEPHVQDLCKMLNSMGAQIDGIGSNRLTITGVGELHGTDFTISNDHIEIGSFIGLGAVTRGELRIAHVNKEYLKAIDWIFRVRLGVEMWFEGDTIVVADEQNLRIKSDAYNSVPKIEDAPWPGFPADLTSIALAVATQAEGTILIHEKLFESRLFFVDKLISMGARIVLCDPHRAVVVGPAPLHGGTMESPDIRAGMALLLASLSARGKSVIGNVGQIDRGYERIDERLRALGARIQRIEEV